MKLLVILKSGQRIVWPLAHADDAARELDRAVGALGQRWPGLDWLVLPGIGLVRCAEVAAVVKEGSQG